MFMYRSIISKRYPARLFTAAIASGNCFVLNIKSVEKHDDVHGNKMCIDRTKQ